MIYTGVGVSRYYLDRDILSTVVINIGVGDFLLISSSKANLYLIPSFPLESIGVVGVDRVRTK